MLLQMVFLKLYERTGKSSCCYKEFLIVLTVMEQSVSLSKQLKALLFLHVRCVTTPKEIAIACYDAQVIICLNLSCEQGRVYV